MEIANKTMENFNPATDSVAGDFDKLPDGSYNCTIESVKPKKNDKGTEWINFMCCINDGDYAGRYIFVNYFMTEKTVERSIKAINKLVYEFGYQLPIEAFETLETLAENLSELVGNQVDVEQKTSKNGYENLTMSKLPF